LISVGAYAETAYDGDVFHAQIADASPACIWLLNPQGRIVHVNLAARRFQPDCPAAHTMAWRDAWPAACRFSIDRGVQEAQAGRPFAFRTRFATEGSAGPYLDTTVSAVTDEEGRIVRLLVKAEDVTAETETNAFLNTVIDVLPLALTVKDARTGRYILANRAAEKLFGRFEGFTGMAPADVLPPTLAAWADEAGHGAGSSSIIQDDHRPNGVRYLSATKVATYDDEGVRHLIDLIDDITQKQQGADALVLALEQAEQAEQARCAFVSNISHEIRTPLNGVIAGLDLLEARSATDVSEITTMIRASAAELQTRFEQLLAISRLHDPDETTPSAPFDLATLAERVAAPCRTACEAKGVSVTVEIAADVPAVLMGDSQGIERALEPLLDNAAKFTDSGSIRLVVEAAGTGRVRFSCIDTGVGFETCEKEALFAAFHQRDAALTRQFGGLGLGLALARRQARAIGGVIDARPGDDGGSVFWLDLPLAHGPEGVRASDEQIRILVVDDHPTNRRIVEMMLEGIAEVHLAEDGLEAVEAARLQRFDVIFMDIQMPRMDGITAVARIREAERTSGAAPASIIMLTANTQPEHVAASRSAGADRHLGKPFTAAGLLSEIQAALAI
jgi:signal transduction histidine kinase/CheY-like chemotaxis protein